MLQPPLRPPAELCLDESLASQFVLGHPIQRGNHEYQTVSQPLAPPRASLHPMQPEECVTYCFLSLDDQLAREFLSNKPIQLSPRGRASFCDMLVLFRAEIPIHQLAQTIFSRWAHKVASYSTEDRLCISKDRRWLAQYMAHPFHGAQPPVQVKAEVLILRFGIDHPLSLSSMLKVVSSQYRNRPMTAQEQYDRHAAAEVAYHSTDQRTREIQSALKTHVDVPRWNGECHHLVLWFCENPAI